MIPKFLDLSRMTLTSAGQPNFGDAELTPLTDELASMVSGGVIDTDSLEGSTNKNTCSGSNTGCTNSGDCALSSNTGCSNSGTCYKEQQQ